MYIYTSVQRKMQHLILKYVLYYFSLNWKKNNVNQIDTIFMYWSILLSCVKKSLDLGMTSDIPEWNVQCPSNCDNLEQGGVVVRINWMTTIVFVFVPQFHAIDAIITPKSKCRCFFGIASASSYEEVPAYHFENQILQMVFMGVIWDDRFFVGFLLFPSNFLQN